MLRWFALALYLTACFGSSDTPFDPGLEPLDGPDVAAPGTGELPETFNLQVIEADDGTLKGTLRGYVHADLLTTWQAYQDVDVVVDRRRVASWTPRYDVEDGFDFSMAVDQVVEDIVTVEYTLTWRHGAVGDVDDPEKVSMRWQKTAGSNLIDVLQGSVVLLPTDDPDIVEVQSVEHLKAPLTDPEEVEGLLSDVYADVIATVHGQALPVYEP